MLRSWRGAFDGLDAPSARGRPDENASSKVFPAYFSPSISPRNGSVFHRGLPTTLKPDTISTSHVVVGADENGRGRRLRVKEGEGDQACKLGICRAGARLMAIRASFWQLQTPLDPIFTSPYFCHLPQRNGIPLVPCSRRSGHAELVPPVGCVRPPPTTSLPDAACGIKAKRIHCTSSATLMRNARALDSTVRAPEVRA
jgi:hypothetical protein